jgi:hypothetical protein
METKLKELEEKGQKFVFLVGRDNEIGTITSEISRVDITRLLAHLFYLLKKEDSKFILTVLCHTFGTKTTEKEKQEILASFLNEIQN